MLGHREARQGASPQPLAFLPGDAAEEPCTLLCSPSRLCGAEPRVQGSGRAPCRAQVQPEMAGLGMQ